MKRLSLFALLGLAALLPAQGGQQPLPGQQPPRGAYGPDNMDPFSATKANDRTVRAEFAALWRDFKSSTGKLHKTIGSTHPDAESRLTQVQTNVLFLEAKWNTWFGAGNRAGFISGRDPYLLSLRADNQLLNKAKKESNPQQALSLLADAATDLQIKADNCRNSEDGLGKEIKVKVHTVAGGKEVGGFEVFYVQKGMFDVKSAHDRFPRESSPTDEKVLSPGAYILWVHRGTFSSDPVALRVGGHGETRLDVELAVPSE
jgi:hypothetical protein